MKILQWFIVAFWLLSYVPPAAAGASNPLDATEFAAVINEVWQFQDQQQRLPKDQRATPAWRVLDRDKLARLLDMPEFAALDDRTKEPLIDQAGAWELMPFDSPATGLAMWAKWFPNRNLDKPVATEGRDIPVTSPAPYDADARWATEAGALVAMLQCYPNAAWYVRHDEPMLWVLVHGTSWDHPNTFDFGMCVRKQSEESRSIWPDSPNTERGKRSATVIERVLSQYLLKYRCTGDGPNRCLPMVHALLSLNPKHESLPAVLKAIEPDFAPLGEVVIQESLKDRRGPGATQMSGPLTNDERTQIRDIARRAMRKVFFLSAKIPVLLDRPGEWPLGEVERTVDALVNLTITLNRLRWLSEGRSNLQLQSDRQWFFADPWRALMRDGVMPASVEAALLRNGRDYANAAGCGATEWQLKDFPPAFWVAYAEAKLEREHTSCGALAYTDAGKHYGEALLGKAEALRAITGLRRYVEDDSAAAREVIETLARECPQDRSAIRHDPWQVCRRAAMVHAAVETARKADEPPKPAPVCSDDLPAQVAKTLGYLVAPRHQVCKSMPDSPEMSILAMMFPTLNVKPHNEDSGEEDPSEGYYDLEVLIVRTEDGEVLSRMLSEKAYTSDAWRLDGLTIDTARYNLASGVRAFGIRVSHSGSSRASPGGESVLSLFIRDGVELRRVLEDLTVEHSQGEWDANCDGHFEESRRAVAVSQIRNKGFADLIVTTTMNVSQSRMIRGECVENATKGRPSRALLRYDGNVYVIPKELKAP